MNLKKILLPLAGSILFYILFKRISRDFEKNDKGCGFAKLVYYEEINGVVIRKFIDSSEHDYEKIVYRVGGATDYLVISYPGYGSLYNFLNIGDEIIKKKNSYAYKVISKKTDIDTTFNFETDCKDSFPISN